MRIDVEFFSWTLIVCIVRREGTVKRVGKSRPGGRGGRRCDGIGGMMAGSVNEVKWEGTMQGQD